MNEVQATLGQPRKIMILSRDMVSPMTLVCALSEITKLRFGVWHVNPGPYSRSSLRFTTDIMCDGLDVV